MRVQLPWKKTKVQDLDQIVDPDSFYMLAKKSPRWFDAGQIDHQFWLPVDDVKAIGIIVWCFERICIFTLYPPVIQRGNGKSMIGDW